AVGLAGEVEHAELVHADVGGGGQPVHAHLAEGGTVVARVVVVVATAGRDHEQDREAGRPPHASPCVKRRQGKLLAPRRRGGRGEPQRTRQVVPDGPSMISTPRPESSPRTASAAAKSLFLRAAARAAMRSSTQAGSMPLSAAARVRWRASQAAGSEPNTPRM